MNINIVITNNSGKLNLSNLIGFNINNRKITIQDAYIYCSNSFAIDRNPYVYIDLDGSSSQTITTSNTNVSDFTFTFPTEIAASNRLTIKNKQVIGKISRNTVKYMDYKIYDYNFDLLAGTVKLVMNLLID